MDKREAIKVTIAPAKLLRHKAKLIESAGEDLGWTELDEAIEILDEL